MRALECYAATRYDYHYAALWSAMQLKPAGYVRYYYCTARSPSLLPRVHWVIEEMKEVNYYNTTRKT
jgi:hypothetical protein